MKPLAIVLAAGGSSRMGRPKALLPLPEGRTLLQAWIHRLQAHCRVCVVQGAVDLVVPPGVELRTNPDWATTGMRESLLRGLAGRPAQAVLVTPVDAPPCTEVELRRLLAQPGSAVLSWGGEPGHPVRLGAGDLARLKVGTLAEALREATAVQAESEAVLLNLNTPEDWQAFTRERR
jgi:CTP:molybdopterin cytidylyltransferase MocA